MRLDKSTVKRLMFLIVFTVAVTWVFYNTRDFTSNFLSVLWGLIYPFILGFILAFLLNIPMMKVEKVLFGGKRQTSRARRPVGFAVTLLLVLLALAAVIFIVVPQLVVTGRELASRAPTYYNRIQHALQPYEQYVPQLSNWVSDADIDWNGIASRLFSLFSGSGDVLNSAYGFASSLFSGVVNFGIAAIFACYLLLGKERLTAQLQAVLQAYLPQGKYEVLHSLGVRTSCVFSKFVGGQCTEALLVGILFVVVLWLGGFQYALLIGVLAGILNLVPIFGGYIALGIGGLLILVSMGWVRAVVFFVVFTLIQQIDGNVIYPRVVGSSVGLSAIWVLVAVTIGGSLFGIVGILFFIPLASIAYALLAESTSRRLAKKGIAYHPPAIKNPRHKPNLKHLFKKD